MSEDNLIKITMVVITFMREGLTDNIRGMSLKIENIMIKGKKDGMINMKDTLRINMVMIMDVVLEMIYLRIVFTI